MNFHYRVVISNRVLRSEDNVCHYDEKFDW